MNEHAFLVAVYNHAAGNPANLVEMLEVGEKLGLPIAVTRRIVQRLKGEGLIAYRLNRGRIALTDAGRRRVEEDVRLPPARPGQCAGEEHRTGIFISYSHLDERWLKHLELHLQPLVRMGLELWYDRRIALGGDWRNEIQGALERSAVAVLLVSAAYFASDFITREEIPPLLAAAADRGLVILPLIISDSSFEQTPLVRFQACNPPSRPLSSMRRDKQEKAFAKLAAAIGSLMCR